MTNRHEIFRYCQTNIPLSSLKASNLYPKFYGMYGSPNKKIGRMNYACFLKSSHIIIATAIRIILT